MAKSDRGFASMPKSRVKEIAAKGGRASGKARRKKKKEQSGDELSDRVRSNESE